MHRHSSGHSALTGGICSLLNLQWLPSLVRLCSPLAPMQPLTAAHITSSSLLLACICAHSYLLARSAISLNRAQSRPKTDVERPRPPALLRAKQGSPFITTACGLAYCCCNLALRREGSSDAVSAFPAGGGSSS